MASSDWVQNSRGNIEDYFVCLFVSLQQHNRKQVIFKMSYMRFDSVFVSELYLYQLRELDTSVAQVGRRRALCRGVDSLLS